MIWGRTQLKVCITRTINLICQPFEIATRLISSFYVPHVRWKIPAGLGDQDPLHGTTKLTPSRKPSASGRSRLTELSESSIGSYLPQYHRLSLKWKFPPIPLFHRSEPSWWPAHHTFCFSARIASNNNILRRHPEPQSGTPTCTLRLMFPKRSLTFVTKLTDFRELTSFRASSAFLPTLRGSLPKNMIWG